jgi:hypothetical protein
MAVMAVLRLRADGRSAARVACTCRQKSSLQLLYIFLEALGLAALLTFEDTQCRENVVCQRTAIDLL